MPEPTLPPLDKFSDSPTHSVLLGAPYEQDAHETARIIEEEGGADRLIIDHYGIDERWESKLRNLVNDITVIDDLADRQHDCNLLLDQTYGRKPQEYEQRVPKNCRILTGADYALLRPQFAAIRREALVRRKTVSKVGHLLVAMGATDPANSTNLVLDALARIEQPLSGCIVLSSSAPHLADIRERATTLPHNLTVLNDVDDMAPLLAQADLAIGASGSMSWERCTLGLPAITIVAAKNQLLIDQQLAAAGAVFSLGRLEKISATLIASTLNELQTDAAWLRTTSENAAAICDGKGIERFKTAFDAGA